VFWIQVGRSGGEMKRLWLLAVACKQSGRSMRPMFLDQRQVAPHSLNPVGRDR
jgi:hypothetical protein